MILRDAWWLLLLGLLPVALWLRTRRRATAVDFSPLVILRDGGSLPRSWRMRLVVLPTCLTVAGLALAVVALARPVERVPAPVTAEGIDIVLCLDVSSSMAAKDLDPQRDRLAVAKAAARQFAAGRPHDRIGLVQFARFPDVVCPITRDRESLGLFLDEVKLVEREGPEDMTGIGLAVARAVQVLDDSEAPSRIVILVTDGEENVASAGAPDEIGPLQAGQLARHHGVRVYTIAVGRGARAPGGQWVPLDTSQVRELAEGTGGRFSAAVSAVAVQEIYAAISGLERVAFEDPQFRLEDRFLPFVLAGLLCLLVGWVLRASLLEVSP